MIRLKLRKANSMKILQINAVYRTASTGRTSLEMLEKLEEKGHICKVVFSKGSVLNPEKELRIGNDFDTKVHGFFSRFTGLQGYFSLFPTKKLLKFIDDYSPNIVLLRNLHGNYIHLPMLLKYLADRDIATVAVLHDCWFYTGKCCHYTKIGCYKWLDGCGGCPSLKNYNKSWFFDRTKKLVEDKELYFSKIHNLSVVAVSKWLKNEAERAPVFKNARNISYIYNWIDANKFYPKDSTELRKSLKLENIKVALSVASGWSSRKGLNTIIELAKRFSENEVFLLIGNINEQVTLPDNVLHIPATDSVSELVGYYSLADVFVQPSLEETFGKVTAEALSCGTPAVCFDSTANPELIGDGCGEVVPVGDIDSMLVSIRKIFADGKENYSNCCRNFALENFSINKNIDKYIDLFNKILKSE